MLKTILQSFIIGLLIALIISVSSLSPTVVVNQSPLNSAPFLRLSRSVVKVTRLTGGGGTGFLVNGASGQSYIVTNAHVCGDATNMNIQRGNELTQYILPVLKSNPSSDLCALLNIPGEALPLGFAPTKYQELFILGHPLLYSQRVSKGYYLGDEITDIGGPKEKETCPEGQREISGFFGSYCVWTMNLSQTSAIIYPGNSGSPITDYQGRVVGVINSGNEMHEGGFIPLTALIEFLKTL